jgi:ribonuclease R
MTDTSSARRGAILDLLTSQTRAMHAREIAARLHVEEAGYSGFLRLLDDMACAGTISPLSGQRFRAKKEARSAQKEREGILSVNARGFGFVATLGFDDDLYVPEDSMGGAMHGDLVAAKLVAKTSRGSEGAVVRVVRRAALRVAGTLRRRGKAIVLEPDDDRIRGPVGLGPDTASGAEEGAAAVVRITRYPEAVRELPEGEIEAVLGAPGDPKVEVAKILVRDGIEEAHPPAAVAEAERFGREVAPEALAGREDLTSLPLPTIDPEDARDHDDAVWARREPDGSHTVWIAIADVSHYVRPGTALDAAARARACSVYLPDRAIPMLPPVLSAALCSLLPDTIRLCQCVEAKLDPDGVVTSYRVVEGFMKSAAKLTYGEVARALKLTDKGRENPKADALIEGLTVMRDLSGLLRKHRMRRGALDFELPEAHVVLSPDGAPSAIERRAEDPGVKKAYQIVEELMLLGNELVARFLTDKGVPAIYRVHGPPDEEKLDRFATMCKTLGVAFDPEQVRDPKKLSALLKRVAKHPSRDVFNMLLLRAMKQASYDTANIGHFGLASPCYLHFTSPIRRYPDLVVHRAVRAVLRGEPIDRSAQAVDALHESATLASQRERNAMDVEREVVDLYRALYMRDYVGKVFSGRVTGLVGSGVFVQLDAPFVDVLVKCEELGRDQYELDDTELRMVGSRSGDVVALGDALELTVIDVALLRRTVYGRRIADETHERRPSRRPGRGKGERGKGGRGRRGKR